MNWAEPFYLVGTLDIAVRCAYAGVVVGEVGVVAWEAQDIVALGAKYNIWNRQPIDGRKFSETLRIYRSQNTPKLL